MGFVLGAGIGFLHLATRGFAQAPRFSCGGRLGHVDRRFGFCRLESTLAYVWYLGQRHLFGRVVYRGPWHLGAVLLLFAGCQNHWATAHQFIGLRRALVCRFGVGVVAERCLWLAGCVGLAVHCAYHLRLGP